MANRTNSPLLGYNTNVKHSGHVFHIQTEDSGLERPHVITHLFTSGTILSTKKTSYAEVVRETDWEDRVRQLMKDQHKAMFIELREGKHDEIATRILGVPIGSSVPPGAAADGDPTTPSLVPPLSSRAPAPATRVVREDEKTNVRIISPAAMTTETPQAKRESSPPSQKVRSIFATPDAGGSFGENLISDKSLDEVILTYLKDELEEEE